MIEVQDLRFRYGDGAFQLHLDEVVVSAGETVAVIGPSGSGKTTLLHVVAGILLPVSGTIRVGEYEVTALGDAARRAFRITNIGMVFQEFELLDYLGVLDNVLLPYRISGALHLHGEVRERALGLLERVGLGDKVRRPVRHLSQGERQRVGICRALLPNPPVLFADEPTGNLDPGNAGRVLDILLAWAAERRATVLTVTHDHALLPRFGQVLDAADWGRA